MPRIQVPLAWRVRSPDPAGPVRLHLRAEVRLQVEARPGRFVPLTVLVDTGASFSVLSATLARFLGLRVPAGVSTLRFQTAAGVRTARVSDLELTVRLPQLPEHPFRLLWLVQHDLPPGAPPVLGLHNTIDFLRLTADGAYVPQSPMGHLVVEVTPSP